MLTPELQKKLIDSVHAEVGSRSIPELEAERDEMLLGLLELRAEHSKMPPSRRSRPKSTSSDGLDDAQDRSDLFGASPLF
ncbi:hypothetical protein [Bradyrhizobium sp. AS23.2]|uniref:hypothetical protein n=1 Tax=Bradyrhizobium sp. AS23.2 TaxID=1680155 RepID=UPI0009393E4F|nr:hypothetical protein [Bradyrhizobium sp. AS23.2]OKO73767.1 hypothetical protein AC630_27865 [Bradyrhizobium sp. AS23.2]